MRAKHADQAAEVQGLSDQLLADMAQFKMMFAELKELREEAREREEDAALVKAIKDGGEVAGEQNL